MSSAFQSGDEADPRPSFTLRRLTRGVGLRGRLMAAIGVVLSGTLIAAAVALLGYADVRANNAVILNHALPAMVESMGVAQRAETLVALAPALSAAADRAALDAVSARIRDSRAAFTDQLERLRATGSAHERLATILTASTALLDNLAALDAVSTDRIAQAERRAALLPGILEAGTQLQRATSFWKTSLEGDEEDAHGKLADSASSPEEMRAAAALLAETRAVMGPLRTAIEETANATSLLLESAAATDDASLIRLRTRLGASLLAAGAAGKSLPEKLRAVIASELAALTTVGAGDDGLIGVRRREVAIVERANALMADNRKLADGVAADIAALVADQRGGIDQANRATEALLDAGGRTQVAVCAASLLISILVVWLYVGRRVVGRLLLLKDAMQRIADGDLARDVVTSGSDEITQMGAVLRVFRNTARAVESARAEADVQREQAARDRRAAMLGLADGFEAGVKTVVDRVSTASDRMHQTAEGMVTMADGTVRQASDAAQAAERASANVDSAAAAAQELSQSIEEISRQVTQSATIAGEAAQHAERTDATMRGLDEAAARIGAVLDLISGIAGQTNLLALNATIEAARAGDAGKGFAVVAHEVKQLATQTAQATGQIAAQINAMQGATAEAVGSIRVISATIARLNDIAATIAASVEEQGAATAEIARSVREAADRTEEATANIRHLRATAGQAGESAQSVLAVAGSVTNEVGHLTGRVGDFLANVRRG
ncbi:HAMP domain-containing protein [Azospirillum cavernae]|uniref:HAMP domain-containing protein n=1 Tax=Azospirillum cavernae TaxID=2320860 RepID=A0A418VW25_9PROT|nr:HAMP domain-containing methyl-accepting chemotaxis protein [Azospirillum cavernae]RJF81344.1 HAMP domain-containing protein [Azospirillum cavernae]